MSTVLERVMPQTTSVDVILRSLLSYEEIIGAVADAGQCAQAFNQLIIERHKRFELCAVIRKRRRHVHENEALGAEAGVDSRQRDEAPSEQGRADDQQKRECDLSDDEASAQRRE